MTTKPLAVLSDVITDVHNRVQTDFKNINPVVGVSHNMRASGVPADVITIDCLTSGKRIILLLHDEQPEIVRYQFCLRDKDPEGDFEIIQLGELTTRKLYDWVVAYFLPPGD